MMFSLSLSLSLSLSCSQDRYKNRFQVVPNEKKELEGTFEKFKSKVKIKFIK